jgi:transposase InsO family protein
MKDSLALSALRIALSRRILGPDLVHHSERGSQYASGDYTSLLKENGIVLIKAPLILSQKKSLVTRYISSSNQ